MKELKTYQARSGHMVDLDISDEACEPYGFKHGDRVRVTCNKGKATVIGVGRIGDFKDEPLTDTQIVFAKMLGLLEVMGLGKDVLWYVLDDEPEKGRVSYGYPLEEGDLKLIADLKIIKN